MIARYSASLGSAAIVTFGLLLLMQTLIATGVGARTERSVHRIVPFLRIERPPPDVSARVPPDRIQSPDVPPVRPTIESTGGTGPGVQIRDPSPPTLQWNGPDRLGLVDGDALPIVTVAPQYPAAAIPRGLEGFATVEFSVSRIGTVSAAAVVESSHSVFDKPAIDAVYKFKYRPRVINGEAVEMHGIRYRFTFLLDR